MIDNTFFAHEKYRGERSGELCAVCDIHGGSVTLVLYDRKLSRRYARAVCVCPGLSPANAAGKVCELVSYSMRELSVEKSEVIFFAAAAPFSVSLTLEGELLRECPEFFSDIEIFVSPFISHAVDGRFTAMLMAVPDSDFLAADLSGTLSIGRVIGDKAVCAGFLANGAFDASALVCGMPPERGAVYELKREKDGGICYGVYADAPGMGVSAAAAFQAVRIMREIGCLDEDGIMTDRDMFFIGEEQFVTQNDVRVIQADKALSAAAFSTFMRETGKPPAAYLSGDALTRGGFSAMLELRAVPECLKGAGYCQNSVIEGLIRCSADSAVRARAERIADGANDISERLRPDFEVVYLKNIRF